MKKAYSIRLRYVGPRFNDARLPLDVLSDLSAFRDLLVAFAKDEWRNLNTDRRRVPKGFEKSLSFDLVAIEDGSAIPKIDWNRHTAQANLPGFDDQLEKIVTSSVKDVADLIDGSSIEKFPKSLSNEHIRALNRFGAGLRENERIEIVDSVGENGNVVYLDATRRKRLITRVHETYETRIEGIGILGGNLTVNNQVIVTTQKYGDINIILDRSQIKEEFDGNLDAEVQFDLQVELDNNDVLRRVVTVNEISVIDSSISVELLKCRNRLAELGDLMRGWHNGEGESVSKTSLQRADLFISRRAALAEKYKIYPTTVGGITIEFEFNDWDYTVEFCADGSIEMCGVAITSQEEMPPQEFGDLEVFLAAFGARVGQK